VFELMDRVEDELYNVFKGKHVNMCPHVLGKGAWSRLQFNAVKIPRPPISRQPVPAATGASHSATSTPASSSDPIHKAGSGKQ